MQILLAVVLIALGVAVIVLRGRVAAFATWVRKDVLVLATRRDLNPGTGEP